jgi:glycosyltransferase involved in cell wall biosynthesis
MKILFISRKYPPGVGGMQLFARDLYAALGDKAGTRLVKWGGSNKALPVVLPYLYLRAVWEIAKGGIDVIHIQDGLLAPLGYMLAKLSGKPFGIVIHGLDITYDNKLYRLFVPWAVRKADVVFCISQAAANEARQRGVAGSKIHVVPLAVADELYGKSNRAELIRRLQLPAGGHILLTVGRLVKRKGVAWFISNVLPGLVRQYPDLIYLVAGEGGERHNIEASIKRSGMAQNARLLGTINGSLYEAAYNGADVFVMPNINVPGDIEGFGLVLLEASSCALPVVAADTEGIRDAVKDGKNGVLVPVGDAAAFQREIERFLADPARAKQFGAQSRDFTLATYQWDKIAGRYIEQYQRLLH